MPEPPSPTVGAYQTVAVVGADEQTDVAIDVDRWCRLAHNVLEAEGRGGELTLTFVAADEMAGLNAEHLGEAGVTDVLSFPLDAASDGFAASPASDVPVLLGDVVVCPAVAAAQAPMHAGTLDDELALLVVHGVLHVLGHDHAAADDAARMRLAERRHLEQFHWNGPAPSGFHREHSA